MSRTSLPFDSVAARHPDPLGVLKTTRYVVERARHVTIDLDAIERAADMLIKNQVKPPAWNEEFHYFDGTPRTVDYLFWLDALNFSFWGEPRWKVRLGDRRLGGYWALAASLKRAVQADPTVVEAESLARMAPHELKAILHGDAPVPMFPDRWRNTRELGTVLKNKWEGQAARLVEGAERDAPRLARMIAENFSSFADISIYDGQEVRFFKRAQILVTDLWGAFRGQDWGAFENIQALTAFADYKLPQVLRAWDILLYDQPLADQVDNRSPLEKDSPQEVEIRAATLWAVELLRASLAQRGRELWSVQVDWVLWDASQLESPDTKPYHRVRTIYY